MHQIILLDKYKFIWRHCKNKLITNVFGMWRLVLCKMRINVSEECGAIYVYSTTRYPNPEDCVLNAHCREDIKTQRSGTKLKLRGF
jgi:hypothetical protein